MWALVRLSARVRLLFRGGRDRAGSGPVDDLRALAPWCRGDVFAVLRDREQAR
jgi:hypothetical protein